MPSAAILDVDGTLVDTNYQHALAWYQAFRRYGIILPIWRIHRHIGMGGDQLVEALTDADTESETGDDIREAETDVYSALIEDVEPFEGARRLIAELKQRGHTVVLASSAKDEEIEHYVDLLEARELADAWTSSGDVESTKPQPDLVHAALDRAEADAASAVLVGDTPWDVKAAKAAEVPTIAVRTGGFSIDELEGAGAVAVFESIEELCERLDETRFGDGAEAA